MNDSLRHHFFKLSTMNYTAQEYSQCHGRARGQAERSSRGNCVYILLNYSTSPHETCVEP